jgi:hypothetical protein
MAEIGLPASSPHSVTGVPLRAPSLGDLFQHPQERHGQGIESIGERACCRGRRHDELE